MSIRTASASNLNHGRRELYTPFFSEQPPVRPTGLTTGCSNFVVSKTYLFDTGSYIVSSLLGVNIPQKKKAPMERQCLYPKELTTVLKEVVTVYTCIILITFPISSTSSKCHKASSTEAVCFSVRSPSAKERNFRSSSLSSRGFLGCPL